MLECFRMGSEFLAGEDLENGTSVTGLTLSEGKPFTLT